MLPLLSETWGLLMVRGVLAVIFGVIAITMPGPALLAVVILFGAYAFVDGIVAIIAFFGARGRKGAWWLLFAGILGLMAGVLTLFFPGMTALALLSLVAAWSIVTGVFAIAAAIRLRKELTGEWRLYLAGALSITFGVLLVLNAATGLLALMWLMGFYAILYAVMLISLALRVRHIRGEMAAAH
jgi:uncharacterized membrane protein HdeD (DUF308 family)